ncbi:MAG: hypothetical protein L0338_02365 [Acidobacteria bacterium]|nr:hypothetical protein [Acidobacteriota bacterium]
MLSIRYFPSGCHTCHSFLQIGLIACWQGGPSLVPGYSIFSDKSDEQIEFYVQNHRWPFGGGTGALSKDRELAEAGRTVKVHENNFYDITVEVPGVSDEHRTLRLRRLPAMDVLSAVKKAYQRYFSRTERHPRGADNFVITIRKIPSQNPC